MPARQQILDRRALGLRGCLYWNRGEPLKPAARAPGPFLARAEPLADPARAFVPCAAPGSLAKLWLALLRGQPARRSSSWRSGEALSSWDATSAPRRRQGVRLLLNAELPRSSNNHGNLPARQHPSVGPYGTVAPNPSQQSRNSGSAALGPVKQRLYVYKYN